MLQSNQCSRGSLKVRAVASVEASGSAAAKVSYTELTITPQYIPKEHLTIVGSLQVDDAPLLLRALRGEAVERPPVWMMRQAGRYMKVGKPHIEHNPSINVYLSYTRPCHSIDCINGRWSCRPPR